MSSNINNTLAMMIRRAFANLSDGEATKLFLETLRGSDGKDAARAQVAAAIHKVYDAERGKRILRKDLNPKVEEILGSEFISSLAVQKEKMTASKHHDKCMSVLRTLMDDTLSNGEFQGQRGRVGGSIRLRDQVKITDLDDSGPGEDEQDTDDGEA